jgi:hypothetical protein
VENYGQRLQFIPNFISFFQQVSATLLISEMIALVASIGVYDGGLVKTALKAKDISNAY